MSKGKLEEIKKELELNQIQIKSPMILEIKPKFLNDIRWLIEQVERVPALESHLSKNGNKYKRQNKRLRNRLNRMTNQRNKYRDKSILNQMTINLENHKKEIRERTLEGYKNLNRNQSERVQELEVENEFYHSVIYKIGLTINNPGTTDDEKWDEVNKSVSEALESESNG